MLGELFIYAFEYILGLQTRNAAILADKTIHFFTEFESKKEFISLEFKSSAEVLVNQYSSMTAAN